MKRYSDLEVDLLIDAISEAALEAIEQAAGEAAKAAVLSMAEREVSLLQVQASLVQDVANLREEVGRAKKIRIKNAVIAGLISFICGVAIGVAGYMALNSESYTVVYEY